MNERDEHSTGDDSTQILQSHARFEPKLEVRRSTSDDYALKNYNKDIDKSNDATKCCTGKCFI